MAARNGRTAVRSVDLSGALEPIDDVFDYDVVRVYAHHEGRVVGFTEVANRGEGVSASRLRESLVDSLNIRVLADIDEDLSYALIVTALAEKLLPGGPEEDMAEDLPLDRHVTASVVVATFDRPDDLRMCLGCLTGQQVDRDVEVVVVDNNPASGLTPPVVAEFPSVRLVEEARRGSSFARNAGIRAATGDIILMTDDDVRAPAHWVERLLAPFGRPDVAGVTGNILPLELEGSAQRLFEAYGGLGRGFRRKEFTPAWFEGRRSAVPTWEIGGTANTAFRSWVFQDPEIGLLHEALGAGIPAAVGEDTYLFYKVLKAGHTIAYEPDAWVWHRHRSDMAGLQRQLYGYSKGHVAYHLTTLIDDRDLRSLHYLAWKLPKSHFQRLRQSAKGPSPYPIKLNLLEIAGNILGPLAFHQSRRLARQAGAGPQSAATNERTET
ncbi:MAG TPA: glycosyltransferase [Acidimicrobiales bacterium]|nr:glycosyltransferase [Acidimicrobiales bacterium]